MAPGATKFGNNRFALLSPSPKAKRKKSDTSTLDLFPELPIAKKDDPRFLVVRALDGKKPLTTLSCFAIYKGIQAISKEVNNITELRDGSLLLLVKNKKIADKFLATNKLPGVIDVTVKLHESLNSVKGTIYAPFLCHLSEEEIVDGLQENGVKSAFKFFKVIEGSRKYTGSILLTFDKYHLPDKIEVAWRTLSVRAYYPNPMRCKVCQILGHTAKNCRNSAICATCNLPPHSPSECTRVMCANCQSDHPSSSNLCPKFQQTKEILKIKTINKCSMRDAIKKYNEHIPPTPNPTSFASVAKASLNNIKENTSQNKTITPSIESPLTIQSLLDSPIAPPFSPISFTRISPLNPPSDMGISTRSPPFSESELPILPP